MSQTTVLTAWPENVAYVQTKLSQLMASNPRYENSWFGPLSSVLGLAFPSRSPRQYYLHPQFILRKPVQGVFPIQDATEPELSSSDADHDDEAHDDEAELLPDFPPDVSFTSQDYAVQGRGQGREEDLLIPDFMIDQRSEAGHREFVLLVEVKPRPRLVNKDFDQILGYGARLASIAEAGGAAHNTTMMLVAGGLAYVWTPDDLPTQLSQRVLGERPHVQVDTVGFFQTLELIRTNAFNGLFP